MIISQLDNASRINLIESAIFHSYDHQQRRRYIKAHRHFKKMELVMKGQIFFQRRITIATVLRITETKPSPVEGREPSVKSYACTVDQFIKSGRIADLHTPLETQIKQAKEKLERENLATITITEEL